MVDQERSGQPAGLPARPFPSLCSGAMEDDKPVAIPVTDIFDLHAFAPRDVKNAVEAYLEEAHKLGLRALRIIHGRGIGVQRELVRSVLSRTDYVIDFRDAPAEAGGWGATIVTLRADLQS